jgi:asparagine synthase (glutamine-hydrolysing)
MCGIVGIVQQDDRPIDLGLLEAMTNALVHRGPDGEGYVLLGRRDDRPVSIRGALRGKDGQRGDRQTGYHVGLGHRRLAIVDLTPSGHQPMGSEDGRFWITYNGEVYNAPELRQELTAAGARFHSTSDTEVVLESYRHWGRSCLHRFNGMFAFAVWDGKDRNLFCARDRFGIKPFYYRHDHGRFLFASEIKALLHDATFPRRPNENAVWEYLSSVRHDHGANTFFDGVQQLQPGESLTVWEGAERHRGHLTHDRWWQLPQGALATTAGEASSRLHALIEDSVRLQLRADVPVGSCLSGGLDSSSIVCLMSQLLAGRNVVETFSSCSENEQFDERPYIRSVVALTQSKSHEVFPDGAGLLSQLPDILWHQEEPVDGMSTLAQWNVMRAVHGAGVKVVLDGQGGDEVLCGYPGFIGSRLADLTREGRWLAALSEWNAWRSVHGRLQSTAKAGLVRGLFPAWACNRLRNRMMGHSIWMNRQFLMAHSSNDGLPRSPKYSVLDAHVARTITQDLPALLHYEDRNSMAFSVEARLPFLDHRLVEWLVQVPPELKLSKGMTKVVLRQAMAGVLPDDVRLRTDKMGFVTPEDEWLRGPWRFQIESLLNSDRMRARHYWQVDVLKDWYRRYCDGNLAVGPAVWRWVNLELWLRRFCD